MNRDKLFLLFKKNNINIEKDVFEYGLITLETYCKYLLFIIPISIFCGLFKEVMIFIILFIPVRRYLGGFHMKTMKACFYGSVVLAIVLPYFASIISFNSPIIFLVVDIICLYLSIKIGTIDHPNKKIDNDDKKKYTNKAFVIESTYIMLSLIAYLFSYIYVINVIMLILLFCTMGNYISSRMINYRDM